MITILAKVYIPYIPNIVVRLSETKLQELLLHIFCVRNALTSRSNCLLFNNFVQLAKFATVTYDSGRNNYWNSSSKSRLKIEI